MTVVSVREVTPHIGKEKLVESRMRRGEAIIAKHGAQTRLFKTVVGQGVGDYIMMSMYESFSKATKSFQSFSVDPDMATLVDERSASPSGDMKGPDVYRMAYGAPSNPPRPLMVQRMYHMPRKNLASALALAPELDELMKSHDVSVGAAVPIATSDHEMMSVVYRFKSMDHYGEALDAMVDNQEFAALVEKANTFGSIKSSRVIVAI
jgi:hypothetical protein